MTKSDAFICQKRHRVKREVKTSNPTITVAPYGGTRERHPQLLTTIANFWLSMSEDNCQIVNKSLKNSFAQAIEAKLFSRCFRLEYLVSRLREGACVAFGWERNG